MISIDKANYHKAILKHNCLKSLNMFYCTMCNAECTSQYICICVPASVYIPLIYSGFTLYLIDIIQYKALY